MKPVQAGMLAFKLIVTGVLLWFLFRKVDIGPVATRLVSMQAGWAAVALAVLLGQLLLTGVRWYFVGQLVGAGIGFGLASRLILVGQFFNQVLPSSVGGDGVRAWLLSREGISIRHALVSVICDRAAALVLLTVIVACTLPIVILSGDAAIPYAWPLAIALDALTVGGLLFLFLWGGAFSAWLISLPLTRPLGVVIRDLRLVLLSSAKSLWVVGLTIVVQAMVVMSTYFCALALRVEFGTAPLLMLPIIMLISSIPISFAGWGLRESAMVAGLGFAGISAGDALAISVSFGIAQILVGLPGVVVAVMSSYGRKKPSARAVIRPAK
ncbi:lysylphosphatidylglycerol synthase transmembrane domain-containing protein [Sulfuriferula sp.]|uniref:lysylphosphatidylglycerol synthase transmembrane domain-containing protein n=1 Tax=Sulfuriferula sp. TaxID=2025307 RepID=UPI00272EED19|nr:lysylphosphatidylglycerol synthase transmembrane domain-containing protein [Sulfuriferula sp.]MDP2025013.1 lysylphosphatidylglycerol synthase transmembrane domain-containing protein [Sulfuriferula sp.]